MGRLISWIIQMAPSGAILWYLFSRLSYLRLPENWLANLVGGVYEFFFSHRLLDGMDLLDIPAPPHLIMAIVGGVVAFFLVRPIRNAVADESGDSPGVVAVPLNVVRWGLPALILVDWALVATLGAPAAA